MGTKNFGNQDGYILITLLIIGALIAVIAMTTMLSMKNSLKTVKVVKSNYNVLNIAEAGKEHALSNLRAGNPKPTANSSGTIASNSNFGGGSYFAQYKANSDMTMITITSTGTFGSLTKIIEATFNATPCNSPVDFQITGGTVKPTISYKLRLTVLGCGLSYGGQYNMHETVRIFLGSSAMTPDPFGDYTNAKTSNINTGTFPQVYDYPTKISANTAISVYVQAWTKSSSRGTDTTWGSYSIVNSVSGAAANPQRVYVLRNGSSIPNMAGYNGQTSAKDFLAKYIKNNKMVLDTNQSVFLFEFTSDDAIRTHDASADFQDAVILTTLSSDTTGTTFNSNISNNCTGGFTYTSAGWRELN